MELPKNMSKTSRKLFNILADNMGKSVAFKDLIPFLKEPPTDVEIQILRTKIHRLRATIPPEYVITTDPKSGYTMHKVTVVKSKKK